MRDVQNGGGGVRAPGRGVDAPGSGATVAVSACALGPPRQGRLKAAPTAEGLFVAVAKLVFLGVVAERAEAHSEHLGGLHLHAAGALEGERQVVTIERLAAGFQVESLAEVRQTGFRVAASGGARAFGTACTKMRGQRFGSTPATARAPRRARSRSAAAHVARPVVGVSGPAPPARSTSPASPSARRTSAGSARPAAGCPRGDRAAAAAESR